ncbi:MAG: transglutaminase domain-containing protein, partial [Phycisphaerales bacterium]|nr:transglutaminase domain-containing protein [Phycisphaerales bacterium]
MGLRHVKDSTSSIKAEALRKMTADAITDKSLDVGFASASAVVRTHEGDCTEHAVLLVTLLRYANIPARAVSGLVYIDQFVGEQNVFGYHMWAQALLPIDPNNPAAGETWVDLDAAIPTRPFDATHIAITTTDLADGSLATSMTDVARVLGNLRIKVESVEYATAPAHTP